MIMQSVELIESVDKIKKIISRLFKIDILDDSLDEPLTGSKIGLSAVDMTYLFFEVEKVFEIRINTDLILNYEFNTVNGIADLLQKAVA